MRPDEDTLARRARAFDQLAEIDLSLEAIGIRTAWSAPPGEIGALIAQLRPEAGSRPLIRVGGNGDGGYLVPDDLKGVTACFSPGVSDCSDFESELARRGIRSFLADASVDGPAEANPLFDFEKRFLGDATDATHMRLADWVAAKADPAETEMILQMDIEGAEYPVLLDTPDEVLRRFRILAIEFHGLGAMMDGDGIRFFRHLFGRLLRHFAVVHIHPNNIGRVARFGVHEVPDIMEFTFHRRDRHVSTGRAGPFPHPLDVRNVADYDDVVLPPCWRL